MISNFHKQCISHEDETSFQSNAINRPPFAWFLFVCVLFFYLSLTATKLIFKALGYVVFIAQNWQMFHMLEINLSDVPVCLRWVLAFIFHSRGKYRVEEQVWRIQHSYFLQSLRGLSACSWAGTAVNAKRSWTDTWHMMWHPKGLDITNTCLPWKLSKTKANEKPVCLQMWWWWVEGVPAHGRRVGMRWSLRSLQPKPFCGSVMLMGRKQTQRCCAFQQHSACKLC